MKTQTQLDGLSLEEILSARVNIDGLLKRMKFVLPLSEEVRAQQHTLKISPTKLRTVQQRLEAALKYRDELPPSFDLVEFERDAAAAVALGGCLESIDLMRAAVRDTLLIVANRAIAASNSAYGYLQVGTAKSTMLQSAVGSLRVHRSRSATAPEAPETPAKPAEPSTPVSTAPLSTEPDVKVVTDETSKAA